MGLSYVQVPGIDVRASAAFYEKVFGWKVRGDGIDAILERVRASGGEIVKPPYAAGVNMAGFEQVIVFDRG
jgi:predicted enzyme related to lactoylglutathione lyase